MTWVADRILWPMASQPLTASQGPTVILFTPNLEAPFPCLIMPITLIMPCPSFGSWSQLSAPKCLRRAPLEGALWSSSKRCFDMLRLRECFPNIWFQRPVSAFCFLWCGHCSKCSLALVYALTNPRAPSPPLTGLVELEWAAGLHGNGCSKRAVAPFPTPSTASESLHQGLPDEYRHS
jgi:hypothetical protein